MFAAVVSALSGCATHLPPDQSVFVYVASNKAITYRDKTFFDAEMLPKELIKSGATPQNQIILVPQGNVDRDYLIKIAGQCGLGGLPNVMIREQFKASSFTQKRGKGFEKQHTPKPPSVKFSNGKEIKR